MDIYHMRLVHIAKLSNPKIIQDILNELDSIPKYVRNLSTKYEVYSRNLSMIISGNYNINELKMINITFKDVLYDAMEIVMTNTSNYIFPGHFVILYPYMVIQKATTDKLCVFSGEVIRKGTSYISYRPLIDNKDTNNTYILNTPFNVKEDYECYLPKSFSEFEELEEKLNNSYNSGEISEIGYDYYSISTNLKTDHLSLIKLKKK